MSDLLFDIIIDILSRVPVKSLLRFRCVSKAWCVLIDTPCFIETHLNRSIESHKNLTIILGGLDPHHGYDYNLYSYNLYSLDFYSLHTAIQFDNQFKNYKILGSCNGLLLLKGRGRRDHRLVLFNSSTRQHRNLPANTMEYPDRNVISEKYGVGYDSFNNDYKVIRTFEFYEPLKPGGGIKNIALLYSLKSNLWLKIGYFPYFFRHARNKGWGTQVNGALHIVVSINLSGMIVGFDIADKKFYLVPKPDFLVKNDVKMSVDVLGGCLCLVGYYEDYADVWVMKSYGVKESWTKLLSYSSPEFNSFVLLRPLSYSKSRDEVLLCIDEKKLIWYDLKRMEIKNVEVRGLPKMIYAEVSVESLVPLDGYRASGEPKKQNKEEKKEAEE